MGYQRVLVGLLYITMDTIGLAAAILIITTIILERSFRNSQCYQIMFIICALDAVQVFIGLFSGFLTIWPVDTLKVSKVAGALFEPFWICMNIFIFLLSVNRLSIIVNSAVYKHCVVTVCRVLSCVSVVIGLAFVVVFLTPWVTMRYDPGTYCWRYIRTDAAFVVAMIEACSLTPLSLISLCNYIAIIITIIYKKRGSRFARSTVSKSEMRILAQSIALFTFTTTGVFFDFFNFYLLPATKWMYFSLNMLRQICIVMVPILNLLFNRSLRSRSMEYAKYAWSHLTGSKEAIKPIAMPSRVTRVSVIAMRRTAV